MIVVDCNVITYLLLPSDREPVARSLLQLDPQWLAPSLWRSEFLNVLATHLRLKRIDLTQAEGFIASGDQLIVPTPTLPVREILIRSVRSGCSAYDCEYVAAAEAMQLSLVTEDQKVLAAYPNTAVSMTDYIQRHSATKSSE